MAKVTIDADMATAIILNKFMYDLVQAAEKNWGAGSQLDMLKRLIGCVINGKEYADVTQEDLDELETGIQTMAVIEEEVNGED